MRNGSPGSDSTAPIDKGHIGAAFSSLKEMTDYTENWDGEGSKAPRLVTLTAAELFLRKIVSVGFIPYPTLNSEGNAVIEFYDVDTKDYQGSVCFMDSDHVEIYVAPKLDFDGSRSFVGALMTSESIALLSIGFELSLDNET